MDIGNIPQGLKGGGKEDRGQRREDFGLWRGAPTLPGEAARAPLPRMAATSAALPRRYAWPLAYSPNLTLKNWLCAPCGGVTSMVVFTALFFSFTVTPLVIGEALFSPSTVGAA